MSRKVLPGRPYPLGATYDGGGVNFAIYSEDATEVEVCLFGSAASDVHERVRLREATGFIRHGHVGGVEPGQVYAYRTSHAAGGVVTLPDRSLLLLRLPKET